MPKMFSPNDLDNDFRQISVLSQFAKALEIIQPKLINNYSRRSRNDYKPVVTEPEAK